jgi:CheY-like chemotaxis protein
VSRPETKPRVLIVDDEKTFANVLAEFLEAEGYGVQTAYDGEQALRILLTHPEPPDVVLSDVMLPKLSGPQLLSEARRAHARPLPFVLLSAGPPPELTHDYVSFLPKPLRLEELLDHVQALVT